MSLFIEYGAVHIAEEKRNAFIQDAKSIAYYGGLFSLKEVSLYGKSFKLLSFPSFTERYANFYFSYFENMKWENAGIDLKNMNAYSGVTGYNQFAKAVKALYILTELYSDTICFNRFGLFSNCHPIIQWVRYVLKRNNVRIKWRSSCWKIYEQIMEESPLDESVYRKLAPLIFLAALVLSVFITIVKRSPSNILYIFSSVFCPAVPFSALLSFALPFFIGSQRIFSSGAAVAGWSGVSDIGQSKNLIVTDRDLFPAENIEIENVRIFAKIGCKTDSRADLSFIHNPLSRFIY